MISGVIHSNASALYFSRLAELVEAEAENYLKVDPDPFDERHPSRADPNCSFGQMLKILFRKDTFMNKVRRIYEIFLVFAFR